MKTIKSTLSIFMMFMLLLTSCSKDDDPIVPELPKATVSNVEIGLGNNEIGVIGRDLHFNADILAGDKIDFVKVKIVQKKEEAYAGTWSFEIRWDQYKGAKNATVHKHFDIPEDAVEGKYDFLITVNDENGTSLEEKREINIYKVENLPVNLNLTIFSVSKNYTFFYRDNKFIIENSTFSNKDILSGQATIDGISGDGKMYLLLINKKLNHKPESIDQIDFSKVIVYDVFEHQNLEKGKPFSNGVFDKETFTWIKKIPDLVIGSELDNNSPTPGAVNGVKKWESGTYHFGVVYKNTTYNMNLAEYIEFKIDGF